MPPTRFPMPSVGRRGCSREAAHSRLPPSKAAAFATAVDGVRLAREGRQNNAKTCTGRVGARRATYCLTDTDSDLSQSCPRFSWPLPTGRASALRSAAQASIAHKRPLRTRPSPGPRIQAAGAHECHCNRRRIRLSSLRALPEGAEKKGAVSGTSTLQGPRARLVAPDARRTRFWQLWHAFWPNKQARLPTPTMVMCWPTSTRFSLLSSAAASRSACPCWALHGASSSPALRCLAPP